MARSATAPALGREEISDTHARGLRRDLFFRQKLRAGLPLPLLLRRIRTVQWPHRSVREALRAFMRTRQSFRECSDYFIEGRSERWGTYVVAVLLLPCTRTHADGEEPVLAVYQFQMNIRDGRITVDGRRCGRISHHAVERMYQRLRTSSHEAVLEELRKAMYWVALLYGAAGISPRSSTIHQLPVPAGRGVLRCVRDLEARELEVRTFTLARPGGKVDGSVRSLCRWSDLPRETREGAFAALLRDPANRWWRERYQPR
jgi:hypothetical protein